jgi:hypothetical protein
MRESDLGHRTPTLRSLSRLLLAWEKAETGTAERIAAAQRTQEAAEMVQLAAEIAEHRALLARLCQILEHPEELEPFVSVDSSTARTRSPTDTRLLALVREHALGR